MDLIKPPAGFRNSRINVRALFGNPRLLSALIAETLRHFWKTRTSTAHGLAGALKDIWKVGTLGVSELDFLAAARSEMAPSMSLAEYCRQTMEARWLNARMPVRRVSEDEYEACLRNPTEYQRRQLPVHKVFAVEFTGFENLETPQKSDRPVMFLTWHNGAQTHTFLGDLRKRVPSLETFSAYREVFVPCARDEDLFFTTPLMENPKLGMLRMAKSLEGKRAILHYLDGVAGKRDMIRCFFGLQQHFSRGFIHLAREFKAAVMPITAYFTTPKEIRVHLGMSLFSESELRTLDDEQALDKTLLCFLDDLRRNGPAQLQEYPLARRTQSALLV
jgi:hypothetical protein